MRNGAVAIIFGTRPELVKLAPVIEPLGAAATVVHTGQHPGDSLAPIRRDLDLSEPAVALTYPAGSPRAQIAATVRALLPVLAEIGPEVAVVQGDTNSTLAGALAAVAAGIPVVHIEAGLRAFDRHLPEEHNRVLVDHLSTRLCAPSDDAREHLLAEGVDPADVVVTGNTVVDAARAVLPGAADRDTIRNRFGLTRDGYVMATFHRQENVDDPERLVEILAALGRIDVPVLLPVHPRTRDRITRGSVPLPGPTVHLVDPLGYRDFLALLADAAVLVGDSGGVQEEATVVGRPMVVVRRSTERAAGLGSFARLVPDVAEVADAVNALIGGGAEIRAELAHAPSPYGAGTAGARCVAVVRTLLER